MQPSSTQTALAADVPARGTWFQAARGELRAHLPAWMFLVYGCLMLNTELTNLSPPRPDFAWTIVFPLSVFLAYQGVRFTTGGASLRLVAVSLALAFGLPLLNLTWHAPSPLPVPTLLRLYEWSNFVWAALLMWHAWSRHKSHLWLFYGVALAYGAVLENGGIVLGFFHETNLTDTIVPPFVAPVATMVGWSVVLSMATFVAWELRRRLAWLRRSALVSSVALAGFATFLDLQIDPVATLVGCWVWDESLPPWFHGVPRVNFLAWMWALMPFAYALFRLQARRGIADGAAWSRGDLLALLRWCPAALLVATAGFVGHTLVLEGADGPSWTLLNRFVVRVLAFAGA